MSNSIWHDYQYRRLWSDEQIHILSKRMPASWIVSSANFKVMQLITCNTSQSESLFIVTYLTSTVNKYTKVKTWRRTHMTDATPHQVSTNNCVITHHNVVYMTPHTCELNRNRINNWKCKCILWHSTITHMCKKNTTTIMQINNNWIMSCYDM